MRSALTRILAGAVTLLLGCSDRNIPTAGEHPASNLAVVQAKPGSGPGITNLSVTAGDIVIGGPEHPFSLSLNNPGKSALKMTSMVVTFIQGTASRDGGSVPVSCPGASPGVLPPGDCTLSLGATASNTAPGTGTLTSGAATIEVTLVQSNGKKTIVLDTESAPVTLISSGPPSIAGFSMPSPEIVLDGASPYTVIVLNPAGVTLQGILLQGELRQNDAVRAAGGFIASCPNPDGTLPPGTCLMESFAVASNQNGGIGTLVPGPATFVLELLQVDGSGETKLDSRSVPVMLLAPTLSQLSFTTNLEGPAEIYLVNDDGTGQTNLTNDPGDDGNGSWSPDGTRLAFTSNRDGNHRLYVMNANGTGVTQLAAGYEPSGTPAWSPDGTMLALPMTDLTLFDEGIYRVQVNGGTPLLLTRGENSDRDPRWSPDGTRIVFVRDENVFVVNTDGSPIETQLTTAGNDNGPSWSPDGLKILWATVVGSNAEIFVMNPDGSGKTNLTNSAGHEAQPEWSPDGNRIVYTSWLSTPRPEIHVMNPDGSGQTNLSNLASQPGSPLQDVLPKWSPDGTRIAFQREFGGTANLAIFVMRADGTNQTNVTTIGTGHERDHSWKP